MEPVTVGIMAALALFFVIVSLTAFRMLTKETNFEDVYGENAMRLFAEEKSGKQKTSKANKNRAKNIDRKRDNMDKEQKRAEKEQKHAEKEQKHAEKEQKYHEKKIEESVTEMVEPSEAIDGTENGKKTEAVPMHEAKHPRKKNKNKHQTEGPKVTEAVQAEKGGEAPVDLDNIEMSASWTEKIEMVVESTAVEEVPAAEGTEKKAKKKRARRAEDHPREAPKEVMESCASEPKLEDMPALMSTKEEKKTERPKSKRATVSLHDMTADKLHTRLSAVEGLEPEYLSFLAAYFSETGALKAKLSEENATLRKQIGEKERLVLQCTEKLSAAQKKDAEIAHLQQSLTEEKKKYSLFEQSVCTQLSASVKDKNYLQHINEQLKAETAGLKEELKKAQSAIKALPPPVDTTAFQQQADMLRSELSATKKKASQLESELSQRTQTLQQMKSDLQNRELQMEHMKQAGALSEKRFKDAEAASKMEREFLEAKLNETLKAMDELQTLAATAREEAQQRAVSVQSAVEDCRSEFTQQVVSLKHQLANVEKERDILKKENESSLESLSQKDAQHTKEVTKLSDEISQLKQLVEAEKSKESRVSDELDKRSNELAQLYKQVDDLRKQYERECVELSTFKDKLAKAEKASETERIKITTLEKELAEAKAQLNVKESTKDAELKMLHAKLDELKKNEPVAISVITPDDTPEQEVMELSRMSGLGAVPPSASSQIENKVEELRRELAEQQRRNNELRQSNYRIVETAQKQDQVYAKRLAELEKKCEQNVHDNRNIAITAIRTALPSGVKLASLPQSCTDQQYKQWITDAAETLKKSAETKATVSNAGKHEPLPKVAVAATDSAAKIKELEEKVKRYRSALATVSSSIDTIEHEAAQKEKNYEREIAQLKKEIFHSRVLSDKAHRLKEKNITLDKRVNDLMRQLKRERGNGEQLNGQAAELRELLGTNIGDAESATAPFIRRHRSGRRHRKDSSGYNNEAGGESRRRKKCLSESAAHVTFLMAGEDRDPSSGRKSVEDEWEVVG